MTPSGQVGVYKRATARKATESVSSTVSVIIPNFNRMNLISETLRSILNQTRPPDEIIVVDDGSTDQSVDVIRKFEPHVTLLVQENGGPAAARNRGFAAAKGQFIQFFDSDDLCTPNKIEVQLAALLDTGADVAYSPWLQAELRDGLAVYRELPLQQRPLPSNRPPEYFFLRSWVTTFQPCLFRREVLEKAGPFSEDLKPSEDSELLLRILLTGAKLVHVPNTLVLYRLHSSNQISGSALRPSTRAVDWFKFTSRVMNLIDQNPERFSRLDRRIWGRELAFARYQLDGSDRCELGDSEWHYLSALKAETMALCRTKWRGLKRRLRGSAFSELYGVGPLTDYQIKLLRQIGYEPQHSIR
jgi:glycosyltransferase involved in cell wall biosynthesis